MANRKYDGDLVLTKVDGEWKKSWSKNSVRDTEAYRDKCRENANTNAVKVVKRKNT